MAPLSTIVVRTRRAAGLALEAQLTHDPTDTLVVDLEALLDQPGGHPRDPVGFTSALNSGVNLRRVRPEPLLVDMDTPIRAHQPSR